MKWAWQERPWIGQCNCDSVHAAVVKELFVKFLVTTKYFVQLFTFEEST